MQQFFITGTSRGIGKAIAERILQEENTRVTGISRTQTIHHDRYLHLPINLGDTQALSRSVRSIFNVKKGDMDKVVLINNAGTLGDIGHVGTLPEKGIVDIFNINVTAPALLGNAFMQTFREDRFEKLLINVSSGAGKRPVDGWSGYCASKAAIDLWSEVAQKEAEMDGSGFRIFAVAPGIVDTQMQTDIRDTEAEAFSQVEQFKQYKAEGSLNTPEAVAEKYWEIIAHPEKFEEVLQDVRKF